MDTETGEEHELKKAIDRIVHSDSPKKLIVAGPGTGKTTLFRKLLESMSGNRKTRLVLTFINNLKADLEEDLADLARVFTLHGYCQSLLRRQENLRTGLTADFRCLPGMASLIKTDWTYLHGGTAPSFVEQMRNLKDGEELDFYLERSNFYDAVDFDDSVFRVYKQLNAQDGSVESYDLVLIDEYQDFNKMEAALIDLLATESPIVIAGDDDQALYSQLRGSSWEFIRSLYHGDEYEFFELPFCMRCPEVIVEAVNDVVKEARRLKRLEGRIDKPYRHYKPVKGIDSERYPKIDLVLSTVQRLNANYFGRYIEQAISKVPKEEIKEATAKGDPAILVIGSRQYLRQIDDHLTNCGYSVDAKRDSGLRLVKEHGLEILAEEPESNLGWRVVLEFESQGFAADKIREAAQRNVWLTYVIPPEMRKKVLAEAKQWTEEQAKKKEEPESTKQIDSGPIIKLTSFEGAKGLSAQHVFMVGLHEGELPHDSANIQDIEICRFVVGLTRTRKSCSLMHTGQFAGTPKRPSRFLSWIQPGRYNLTRVDAAYWRKAQS